MNLFDRLFDKAIVKENGCWEFSGSRNYRGYGQIRDSSGRQTGAHRVAYDLCTGDIPKGMLVLHKCDNPPCINPEHLFLGTNQDNMDDMANKGRRINYKGEELPQAKLTAEAVIEILKEIAANRVENNTLADRYNVSPQTICDIKAGRTWKHVPRLD